MDIIKETYEKIKNMEIRGAGRIGRAAAKALKEYALKISNLNEEEFKNKMKEAGDILISARPTAVSLPNAVKFVLKGLNEENPKERIIERADEFINSSLKAIENIGKFGAKWGYYINSLQL